MTTPVATVDTQHGDMIHDAQMDYYGRRLATCSSDRCIKIYDIIGTETGATEPQLSAEIQSHEGPVWQVCWSHPSFGTLLASCGYDRRVMVHRETSPGQWTRVYSYEGHSSSVNSIAWAPYEYGLQLACASSDGKVSVLTHRDDDSWYVETFADSPMGVNAVTWAPSHHIGGKLDATGAASAVSLVAGADTGAGVGATVKRIATAGCDNAVCVYKQVVTPQGSNSWEKEAEMRGHSDWVRDVAFNPSSGLGINTLASCADDGTVILWKQSTPGGEWISEQLPVFPGPVWRVSWSTTGNLLAVSCGDSSISLWKESLEGQ